MSLGGLPVYVEPTALAASGGEVLLVGTPTFVTRYDGDTIPQSVAADSILGVVLGRDGPPRAVPMPARVDPQRVIGVRALTRPDGTWAIVFAEVEPAPDNTPTDGPATHLWYGVYDGMAWKSLEPLPLPRGGGVSVALQTPDPSSFVQWGDTLAWALKMTPDGPSNMPIIALFERRDGKWSVQTLPKVTTVYVAAVHSDSSGLLLAAVRGVVRAGNTLRHDENALFLHAERPSWHVLRRVSHGLPAPVDDPSLVRAPTGEVLTWLARVRDGHGGVRQEARVMIGQLEHHDYPVLTIDSNAVAAMPVVTRPGELLWVTNHLIQSGPQTEIRFVRVDDGSAEVIGGIRNPFYAWMINAVAITPSEVLVSGAVVDHPGGGPTTLNIRVRIECGADAR